MNTIEEVKAIAEEISACEGQKPFGEIWPRFQGKLTGREFVAAWGVSIGRVLPETAIVNCPAFFNLLHLSIEEQTKYVVNREPFMVVQAIDRQAAPRRYDELTDCECELLFTDRYPAMKRIAESLDSCDELKWTFQNGAPTGETIAIRRDKPKLR